MATSNRVKRLFQQRKKRYPTSSGQKKSRSLKKLRSGLKSKRRWRKIRTWLMKFEPQHMERRANVTNPKTTLHMKSKTLSKSLRSGVYEVIVRKTLSNRVLSRNLLILRWIGLSSIQRRKMRK